MKKKGFTLIELLAVIVILAVIALILVPLVSNIVDNARKETAKRSVENYILAANNAGAISLVDKNRGIDIKEDYYIFETGETDAELLKIDIKGERPKYAYLEFDVNNKTVSISLQQLIIVQELKDMMQHNYHIQMNHLQTIVIM